MVACSLAHEGLVIPSRARIQVVVDPFSGTHAIHYCRQCRQAACAQACPQEAISQNEDGVWVVDAALCTGCGACVAACTFQAILLPQGCDVALKCDTCDGDPACVASCPRGALTWRLIP
jgi:Fe-S-cluster-containing hydrogenase component 2